MKSFTCVVFCCSLVLSQVCAKLIFRNRRTKRHSLVLRAALALWLLVFCAQPHKEERFMFPVYPLICVAAAIAIDELCQILIYVWPKFTAAVNSLVFALLALFTLVSLSRVFLLYFGKLSPARTYVCVA